MYHEDPTNSICVILLTNKQMNRQVSTWPQLSGNFKILLQSTHLLHYKIPATPLLHWVQIWPCSLTEAGTVSPSREFCAREHTNDKRADIVCQISQCSISGENGVREDEYLDIYLFSLGAGQFGPLPNRLSANRLPKNLVLDKSLIVGTTGLISTVQK